MRQLQAKLSAGILTAVMILGMVFTMAPMKADAATYQDVLNVLAVDENGTPLANVELVFEKDGMTYDFDTTDANGKISDFNIQDDTDMILDGGYGEYVIKPAANSEYTVVGKPCIMSVEKAAESYGFPYIASVYGKPYAGETVQLTLKSASSEKPGENPGGNTPAVEKKVKSVALTKTSYTYNKKAHKPGVVAKDDQGNKIPASDYTVKYSSDCKNVGKYAVTVTFKGEYKGTYTRTYNVVPQGTKLKSVKAGKKNFKAIWKKQKTQTSGYQLAYSTSKKFAKKVKTTTVSKNGTVKKTVKKLSKKKTYYVKVRTYKTVKSGKKTIKLYSGWSAAKKVKTK